MVFAMLVKKDHPNHIGHVKWLIQNDRGSFWPLSKFGFSYQNFQFEKPRILVVFTKGKKEGIDYKIN
jgi:hypothetical protein